MIHTKGCNFILCPGDLTCSHRLIDTGEKFQIIERDYCTGEDKTNIFLKDVRYSKKEAVKRLRDYCHDGAIAIIQNGSVIMVYTSED